MDIRAFSIMIGNLRTSAQFTGTFWATAFKYRPDMPFWRLQGDGFWQLHMPSFAQQQGAADNRQ